MKKRLQKILSLSIVATIATTAAVVTADDTNVYKQAFEQAMKENEEAKAALGQGGAPAAQPAAPAADANADPYADPYKDQGAATGDPYADPYKDQGAATGDPYADPYKNAGAQPAGDPYADPYKNAGAQPAGDPYADPYKNAGAPAGDPYADPYKQAAATNEAAADAAAPVEEGPYVPESGEKYTVEQTADGWYKVVNEDGATLGLSASSGVKLIEEDGLAFKDMNQNGALDAYEDWRKPVEERTADLVSQMSGMEKANLMSHGGWGDFTEEPLTEEDGSYTFLHNGGRGGVTRQISRGGAAHAKWTNAIQEVAESCVYGIPAMVSIDPANISGLVESVSLASTMDPELAAKIGQETAKEYRAAGVTALLGPQVDIAGPQMDRAGGTYGEDPQLTLDITTAYVNGMQSTYDENGEDLGWGNESVYCFTKHFAGAGSTEAGRNDHMKAGRFATFEGDNFEAHLIAYFDGVFNLPGKTGMSGIMTEYAQNVDGNGDSTYGGPWAGAYNPYLYGMLDEFGYDSLKITDWGVYGDFGVGDATGSWGTEGMPVGDRMALSWERGANLLGGNGNFEAIAEAYPKLVEDCGEDGADAILSKAAGNYIETMMNLGMFEQPYNDSAYAESIISTGTPSELGLESQEASVVMIKNNDVIKAAEAEADKPSVYIPYIANDGHVVQWMNGIQDNGLNFKPGMDLDIMGQYFNVVTDTLNDPSGEADENGNPTYVPEDLVRATAEEIADCDYVLVGMPAAFQQSYVSNMSSVWVPEDPSVEAVWMPASLQYAEYTADTAREVSISGLDLEDGTRENRSYKGVTTRPDPNMGALEALEYAKEIAGDKPVIASVSMERGMVWTEVEPLADAILVSYNKMKDDVVARMVLGQIEPNGLLVFQQPANMETVEAQATDVPRDMEVYTDANGNAYDFAFGMNWAGVISDARTEKYSAAPISDVQNFDYKAYAEKNRGADMTAAAGPYVPESGEKYTVEQTADGWYKVVNEDGATLGLSTASGVKLIEDDGYAFKDMNQNGILDVYEDWRLTNKERTFDLVEQMDGMEMANLMSHGGWGDFTEEPLTKEDGSYVFLHNGGRGGVTRQISRGGAAHAKWANAIQEVAESCVYGIPAMISIDPANISGLVESVSLASTMDVELAAAIGQETAKEYRAAGVTALLGPQVDIAGPVMDRAGGTYGEDPQLTLDITTAYVNGMQSTYDENGEDLGWGDESVYCFTKHFAGAGSTEAGRNDHGKGGRFATFDGDNFEAHLIAYFDGVFNLPGKTGMSGIMTEYAQNVDGDGESTYGGVWAGAYNPYLYGMLDEFGYDSLKITDWGVYRDFGVGDATGTWGTDGMTSGECIALSWERGANLLGGDGNFEAIAEAYDKLVADKGEDGAKAILAEAAGNYIETMMNLGMFEQPYCDSAYADTVCYSESSNAFGLETQEASVVMIKNDGTIKAAEGEAADKPSVYVPYVANDGHAVQWMFGIQDNGLSFMPGMDIDVLSQYFNVVTDTLNDPSGEADANGNPTYVAEDLVRATAEDIADCDYVVVGMPAAFQTSYVTNMSSVFAPEDPSIEAKWMPASLQYAPYTAETAREVSISGVTLEDGTKENRSYKGETTRPDSNIGALEALEYAKSIAGDKPVIASVSMERGMVWSEVEPNANVIFVSYNKMKDDVVARMILGQIEPNGLLVFQQPANMETVEAQATDVPRDMEVYTDAAGNAYDFAFGMNWAGVISDARTEKYSAAPISDVTNFDYKAYAAANRGGAEVAEETAEEATEAVSEAESETEPAA